MDSYLNAHVFVYTGDGRFDFRVIYHNIRDSVAAIAAFEAFVKKKFALADHINYVDRRGVFKHQVRLRIITS